MGSPCKSHRKASLNTGVAKAGGSAPLARGSQSRAPLKSFILSELQPVAEAEVVAMAAVDRAGGAGQRSLVRMAGEAALGYNQDTF